MGEFIGQIICSIQAGLGIIECWCFRLGLIWTFFNIKDNWTVYRTYPSVVTQVGQNSTFIMNFSSYLVRVLKLKSEMVSKKSLSQRFTFA